MDRLMDFLIKKAPYVLAVILGFIAPGNILLFVWNQSLYMEMDVVKLLVLSFGISYIAFIPNLLIAFIASNTLDKKGEINRYPIKFQFIFYSISAIGITCIELLLAIFYRLCKIEASLSKIVFELANGTITALGILLIIKFMQWSYHKIKKIIKYDQPSDN